MAASPGAALTSGLPSPDSSSASTSFRRLSHGSPAVMANTRGSSLLPPPSGASLQDPPPPPGSLQDLQPPPLSPGAGVSARQPQPCTPSTGIGVPARQPRSSPSAGAGLLARPPRPPAPGEAAATTAGLHQLVSNAKEKRKEKRKEKKQQQTTGKALKSMPQTTEKALKSMPAAPVHIQEPAIRGGPRSKQALCPNSSEQQQTKHSMTAGKALQNMSADLVPVQEPAILEGARSKQATRPSWRTSHSAGKTLHTTIAAVTKKLKRKISKRAPLSG
ncbi:hypothetical protein U9M48_033226 [Paspalum notatum var. saurae]|uniref:Uncharacterized protein n=1 Tax=Paspalum notatum var. saurae TaxID=547442 RepID=A0AAQ3U9K5_PASNO